MVIRGKIAGVKYGNETKAAALRRIEVELQRESTSGWRRRYLTVLKREVETGVPDPVAKLKAIQLTEDESAELRAESQKEIDRARAEGVYERLLALKGKIPLSPSYQMIADKPVDDDRD